MTALLLLCLAVAVYAGAFHFRQKSERFTGRWEDGSPKPVLTLPDTLLVDDAKRARVLPFQGKR